MKNIFRISTLLICGAMLLPFSAVAEGYNGSEPMICALVDVIECHPGGECKRSDAASVNLPTLVKVDVSAQLIRSADPDMEAVTPIKVVTRLDGKIILQGAEDGRTDEDDSVGWSMSIDQDTGKLIFSASREEAGFVIFGSCAEVY